MEREIPIKAGLAVVAISLAGLVNYALHVNGNKASLSGRGGWETLSQEELTTEHSIQKIRSTTTTNS